MVQALTPGAVTWIPPVPDLAGFQWTAGSNIMAYRVERSVPDTKLWMLMATSCDGSIVVIYPGYTASSPQSLTPSSDLPVTKETPPTFLLQTEDDNTAHVESSLAYYAALKNAGAPVEMHLFTEGGHGYGLRKTGLPVADWPVLAETWLRTIKMLPPSPSVGQ